jgi:hypothetical protein
MRKEIKTNDIKGSAPQVTLLLHTTPLGHVVRFDASANSAWLYNEHEKRAETAFKVRRGDLSMEEWVTFLNAHTKELAGEIDTFYARQAVRADMMSSALVALDRNGPPVKDILVLLLAELNKVEQALKGAQKACELLSTMQGCLTDIEKNHKALMEAVKHYKDVLS